MMIRYHIATRVAAIVLICLVVPGATLADTGPDATDSGTAIDAGDTAISDTSGAPDAGDTASGDTSSVDAGDTGAIDASDTTTADAADTTTGDATDTASGDTGAMDAAGDAAGDVSGDTGAMDAAGDAAGDVSDDTGAMDAGDVSMGDADAADAGDVDDAGADDADAGPTLARFFGEVFVQNRPDDSGVTIALERTDGDGSWEQTTDAEGAFSFDELPLGTYEVEISLDGYVTIMESFELAGDREQTYTLVPDQAVDLRIRAIFEDVEEPPEEVAFTLRGERGERMPEGGAIAVEDGVAEWTVSELGVGNWTLTASAEGFRDVSLTVAAEDGEREQLDLRLYMARADVNPPPPDTSGCGCDDDNGGRGGPAPTPTPGPLGAVVLAALSLVFSRRFISYYSSRD